jgi:hypothetical protein
MSPFASASVSCIHTSVARALTWPNGTRGHRGLLLCDTAAYRKRGATRQLPQFSNFGGNNHKYVPPSLVAIEYRDIGHMYSPPDFPTPVRVVRRTQGGVPRSSRSVLPALERARRYLDAVPPAIGGKHGDLHTFRVCCRLVRGFGLEDGDALALLADWNTRCQPPWSSQDLMKKITRARRYGREPIGSSLSLASWDGRSEATSPLAGGF